VPSRGSPRQASAPPKPGALAPIWHDVECAAYEADLSTWRELAAAARGPILELGCGTGRVALRLAADGFDVTGLDADPELIDALRARSHRRGLNVAAVVADARSFALERTFSLVLAPMQVVQLLAGRRGRSEMLSRAYAHLRGGGILAIAAADPFEAVDDPESARPPLPDILETDGWVYSSTPVALRTAGGAVVIERLRSVVSPSGELTESLATISLDSCTADEIEAEGEAAGFAKRPRRSVDATRDYVGSTVIVLERP
jgi:SAM-dependent methyltransferase